MHQSGGNGILAARNNKFFYGWIIVAASFFIYAIATGQSLVFSNFVKPIAGELHWTRAEVNGVKGCYLLTFAVFALISGFLLERIGPRTLGLLGGLSMGLGFYFSSKVNVLWQFYVAYGVLGGLGFACLYVPLSSVIPKWFIEKKGLALGIFITGGGIGSYILSRLLHHLISTYGWRFAFVFLAAAAFCIILPATFFLRKEPADMGLKPLGAEKEKLQETSLSGSQAEKVFSLKDALKSRYFWTFIVAINLMFFGLFMTLINMKPHATDKGILAVIAADALGLSGLLNSAGRLVMGGLSDKIGTKRALCSSLLLGAVMVFWFVIVDEPWMVYTFAILFGFAFGGCIPQLARMVSELFGVKSMGQIFGVFTALTSFGSAFGPVFGGFVFDKTGSYTYAFVAGGISLLVACGLVMLIKLPKDAPSERH